MYSTPESAAHSAPITSTQRQRLRAIVDRNAELFDPPNTAEAFAKLEAAMDEANYHSSADPDIVGQNDLLDPPNTAERFARIEAAIDEAFASSASATLTQRYRRMSKSGTRVPTGFIGSEATRGMHLRKKQLPLSPESRASTELQAQRYSDRHVGEHVQFVTERFQQENVHCNRHSLSVGDIGGPVNDTGALTKGAHVSAGTNTANSSKHESQRDTDIFRSSNAMDDFANQAYQSAREKYS